MNPRRPYRREPRRYDHAVKLQSPWGPTSPLPPPPTPEETRAAADSCALGRAVAWGFDPADPCTLDLAIDRLNGAARAGADPYADRSDGGAYVRRQEAGDLARQLVEIRERGAHRAGGAPC